MLILKRNDDSMTFPNAPWSKHIPLWDWQNLCGAVPTSLTQTHKGFCGKNLGWQIKKQFAHKSKGHVVLLLCHSHPELPVDKSPTGGRCGRLKNSSLVLQFTDTNTSLLGNKTKPNKQSRRSLQFLFLPLFLFRTSPFLLFTHIFVCRCRYQ